jgi:hypothetical protein
MLPAGSMKTHSQTFLVEECRPTSEEATLQAGFGGLAISLT